MAEEIKNSAELAANLTIAWLNNPNVRANAKKTNDFLKTIHSTLQNLGNGEPATPAEPAPAAGADPAKPSDDAAATPAVTVRRSLASKDHIISMIDGKPYKTLKRHIGTHGMTPAQYRARFGLKADYPMVAPSYSEKRRETAKKIGLGRKPGQKPAPKPAAAKRPGRPKKAAATA